jgi:hypothetical protein
MKTNPDTLQQSGENTFLHDERFFVKNHLVTALLFAVAFNRLPKNLVEGKG